MGEGPGLTIMADKSPSTPNHSPLPAFPAKKQGANAMARIGDKTQFSREKPELSREGDYRD
ncbi:hypothetical protein ACCS78_21685, partial [Rhizobium johnstonii]